MCGDVRARVCVIVCAVIDSSGAHCSNESSRTADHPTQPSGNHQRHGNAQMNSILNVNERFFPSHRLSLSAAPYWGRGATAVIKWPFSEIIHNREPVDGIPPEMLLYPTGQGDGCRLYAGIFN